MHLAQLIERYQVFNNDIRLGDIAPEFFVTAAGVETRRTIALTVADRWLQSIPGVVFEQLPKTVNGYKLDRSGSGIGLFEGTQTIASYDFAVQCQGHQALAKVKSSKLRGILDETGYRLSLAERIYGPQVHLLIFAPFEGKQFPILPPRVHLCDLGYNAAELYQMERSITEHKERI